MALNRCIFQGNLTSDPAIKYLHDGTPLASFVVACNDKYKDKQETIFIKCDMFGKRSETMAQYFSKGSQIIVEGKLREEKWEGQDGQERRRIKLLVSDFHFCGKRGDESSSGAKSYAGQEPEFDHGLEPF